MPSVAKQKTPRSTPPPEAHLGLTIVYRPLRELVPYVRNARTHTPGQIDKIKASLKKFGWTNPMLIADNGMIAGHARLQSAIALAEAGETIRRNRDPWMGPTVDLSHLDEEERRTYILTDNRTAEDAGWDKELLAVEFNALKASNLIDLGLTGFDATEIQTIMTGWNPDMDRINNTDAAMSDLLALIRVKCPKEQAESVEAAVRAAVMQFEGVTVSV